MVTMAERKPRAVLRRVKTKKDTDKKGKIPETVLVSKKTNKRQPKKSAVKPKKATKKVSQVTKIYDQFSKDVSPKKRTNKFLQSKDNTKSQNLNKETNSKNIDKVSLETNHRVAIEDDAVTIFSRVRTANAVILVARVLGLVFVAMGSALAIAGTISSNDTGVMANMINRFDQAIVANLITSQSIDDAAVTVPTTISTQANVTPQITIDIPQEEVGGVINLNFIGPSATKVFVRIYSLSSGTVYNLGDAKTTDGTLWKYQLDTSRFADGDYKVSAHITSDNGVYVENSRDVLKINNLKLVKTAQTAHSTATNPIASSTDTLEPDMTNEVAEVIFKEVATNTKTGIFTDPISVISIEASTPLSGFVIVKAESISAQFAEFYVRQRDSLRDIFIGLGSESSPGVWELNWDTTQIPNGEYKILSKHKNNYGFYWSDSVNITIKNSAVYESSDTQREILNTITKVNEEIENPIASFRNEISGEIKDVVVATTTVDITIEDDNDSSKSLTILLNHKTEIENHMQKYTMALRSGDITERRKALLDIEELKNKIVLDSVTNEESDNFEKVRSSINERFERLVADIESSEEIIKHRIGESIIADTDLDGVTDYDEVTLYSTNPFSADTDNDGFTDQAEILNGFDPKNDFQESAIVYESPLDVGVIRDDILAVENITTENLEINKDIENGLVAILSGRGLPNSFVTLYIFSTPIVITVKTGEDGSWNYRFDKELENGEHQVFVGITDNTGRIIAKSSPFFFVKQAEAFTPVDGESGAGIIIAEPPKPSLLNQSTLLTAVGAVVMALGFILLLITMYFNHSQRKESVSMAHAS